MRSSRLGAGGEPPIPATPSAVHRLSFRERASFAASPLHAPMHGAHYLDDDLLSGERPGLTGLHERTVRVREAIINRVERDGARRLARLGGSEPDLQTRGGTVGPA